MSVTITITTTSTRMHGLGDRAASWRSLQADMGDLGVPVKWQFPDAPIAAVTCNDGYEMTSWFDIEEIPVAPGAKDYPDDIEASVKRIHLMIADLEKEGYDSREIVLGGFSQGGALSLQAMLRYPKRLGGAVCLSGWLMMQQSVPEWSTSANKDTPIFWGHGESDGVVQFALQAVGSAALKQHAVGSLTDKSYRGMQHSTSPAEMRDVAAFFKSLVAS